MALTSVEEVEEMRLGCGRRKLQGGTRPVACLDCFRQCMSNFKVDKRDVVGQAEGFGEMGDFRIACCTGMQQVKSFHGAS